MHPGRGRCRRQYPVLALPARLLGLKSSPLEGDAFTASAARGASWRRGERGVLGTR